MGNWELGTGAVVQRVHKLHEGTRDSAVLHRQKGTLARSACVPRNSAGAAHRRDGDLLHSRFPIPNSHFPAVQGMSLAPGILLCHGELTGGDT
jgi:hypothetical protein